MMRCIWILALATCAAGADNLLANPGFEELKGVEPARWQVFVAPQDGAYGRLDGGVACEGKCSVVLHVPQPYAIEPANNWSQSIITDLPGEELVLRGHIRTEDATEAALWLQCFRRTPFVTLASATTSTEAPMQGTHDWAPVELKLKVPPGTDYLMVRCVLKGTGTAWFDELSLETGAAESKAAPAGDKGEPSAAPSKAKTDPPRRSRPTPYLALPSAPVGLSPELDILLKTQQELLEANRELRASNQELAEQLKGLREELESLRREIEASKKPAPGKAPSSKRKGTKETKR